MNLVKLVTHCKQFKAMHVNEPPLILPNAWDAMSAKLLQQCGFQAIGTTSAGIAASLGYTDGEHIPMDEMLDAISRITAAVQVPVSADLEAGYGCTPQSIGQLVEMVAAAGAAGINVEDGAGLNRRELLNADYQASRIAAIRDAVRSLGLPLFINARVDTYWYGIGSEKWRLTETLRRAEAYRQAGADGLFVPGLTDLATIRSLIEGTQLPLNVLAGPSLPSISALAKAGVARVSTGSAPFRAAMTALRDFGNELAQLGTCSALSQETMIGFHVMNALMSKGGRDDD